MAKTIRIQITYLVLTLLVILGSAKSGPAQKKTPCLSVEECEKMQAYGLEATKYNSYSNGYDAARIEASTDLSKNAKRYPLQILVEDVREETSYRFAAAEVLRTQFPSQFDIVPSATLVLHISGASSADQTLSAMSVRVEAFVQHSFMVANQRKTLGGTFVISHRETALLRYSDQEKTHKVREFAYTALSEFLETITKSTP